MALPSDLVVKQRDKIRDDYLKWYRLRNPSAKVGPGEGAWIDACCVADQVAGVHTNALILAGRSTLSGMTGQQLDDYGVTVKTPRAAESGASGYIVVSTGASGTTVVLGDELSSEQTGLSYRAKRTKFLEDGDTIDVECVEAGPGTNVDPDTVLTWSAPRPGCYSTATVLELPDGSGLSGGRGREEDDDYRRRLALATSNPAAAGNDAEIQRLAEDVNGDYVRERYGSVLGGHGVAVAKAYTYPALLGPGTVGLTFTLNPESATGSRIPSAEQMTSVYQHVTQWLPSDDGVIQIFPVAEDFDAALRVKWASNGWEDTAPFPPYMAEGSQYCVGASTSATVFTVACADATYGSRTAPQVGDAMAVFDADVGVFRRKVVATVSGSGPWSITCDTAAEASDVSFKPVAGARLSPWSDSLDSIADILVSAMPNMGPGEATDIDPGDGRRMLRSPPNSPNTWPSEMASRTFAQIAELSAVSRYTVVTGDDASASVGDAAAVNLLRIADIGILPL